MKRVAVLHCVLGESLEVSLLDGFFEDLSPLRNHFGSSDLGKSDLRIDKGDIL
jgi:hypothetical protein